MASRFCVKAVDPKKTHKYGFCQELPRRSALIAVLALTTAAPAASLFAQEASPLSFAGDISGGDRVSTNQLLTPLKALQAVHRARSYIIAGRIERAQKEITHALDISPRCALALNIQGVIDFQAGHFETAAEEFHQAIDADPALGSAHLGLAMSLIARDRLEDALVPLDRATSLLPGSWLAYFETAIARLGLGEASAALKQLNYAKQFIEKDPERQSATAYLRGVAYIRLKDYETAEQSLEDAVAFEPNGLYAELARKRLAQVRPLPANGK